MVDSALCYLILNEKGNILSCNTVKHLTNEKPKNPNIQQQIHDHHSLVKSPPGSDDFVSSLEGYYAFINSKKSFIQGDKNEED